MKISWPPALAFVAVLSLGGSLGACSGGGNGDGDGDSSGGSTSSGGSGTGGEATGGGRTTGGTEGSGGSSTGGTSSGTDTVFGSPCTTDADCPAVDGFTMFCQTSWPGGYCTAGCSALGPCGEAGSVCQPFAAECYKACTEETEATDCRVAEGYSCVDREGIAGCEN